MMCAHCIKTVEDICNKYKNVISAKTSLELNNVIIEYNDSIDLESIIKNINDADYECKKEN